MEDGYKYFKHAPHMRSKQMTPYEISVRTGSASTKMLKYYKHNIVEFTAKEKQTITWYVGQILPYLEKYARKLIPDKLCFLKLRQGVEFDFPFTLHKKHRPNDGCIVLSEKQLQRAIYARRTAQPRLTREFMNTLVHEMVHLHQKCNQRFYDRIYKQYFSMHERSVKLSPEIRKYLVTNPDGYDNCRWVIKFDIEKNRPTWFLPVLMFKPGTREFAEMLIVLKMDRFGNLSNDGNKIMAISAFSLYTKLYGIPYQRYHPNEIMAHLVSDYIINGKIYDTELFIKNHFYPNYFKFMQ